MLQLKSDVVELRGIENRLKKDEESVYYLVHVENNVGRALNFYVEDPSIFPEGLKKGDDVILTFELSYYKGFERLSLIEVTKI